MLHAMNTRFGLWMLAGVMSLGTRAGIRSVAVGGWYLQQFNRQGVIVNRGSCAAPMMRDGHMGTMMSTMKGVTGTMMPDGGIGTMIQTIHATCIVPEMA